MQSKLLAGLAVALLSSPAALAGELNSKALSRSYTSQQNNSGSVILNPSGGTQVNNNVNNAFSSTYSFGPGISCPTPSFALSAYGGSSDAWSGGYGSNGNAYGASASLIFPLGGDTGESCRKLAAEIAHQRVLDTKINMIRQCASLAQSGIKVSVKDFPEFEACKSVKVNGQTALVNPEPERIFTPPESAIPVVPVSLAN